MIVRKALKGDAEALLALICELAHYERLEPPSEEAKERLKKDLGVRYEAFLAFDGEEALGYAMFYYTYSSFLAKPTFYLEDIFVLEEHRKEGVGRALFERCVEEAKRTGCGRVDFVVLKWNKSAQLFYERHRARAMDDWTLYRIDL